MAAQCPNGHHSSTDDFCDVCGAPIVAGADPYLARFAELSQLAPRLHLVIINDATHASASSKPEFVQAIRNFISAHPTQPEEDRNEC